MAISWRRFGSLFAAAALFIAIFCTYYLYDPNGGGRLGVKIGGKRTSRVPLAPGVVPEVLLGSIYQPNDFQNINGIIPPYWGCEGNDCNQTVTWGPCYPSEQDIQWEKEIQRFISDQDPSYMYRRNKINKRNQNLVYGMCRPGFIVIGAGKCGTSSLYHYITEHPRVLPASEKQIHYFKYYLRYPMRWYLEHFPTTESFLASGALVTGEASPGYLPYPEVAHYVQQRMPGPRIIAIGRNPLERAYSSYRYNYVTPTIQKMKEGDFPHIPTDLSNNTYQKYLFSFQDMIEAELKILRECLGPSGPGIALARKKWSQTFWGKEIYEVRDQSNHTLPDLVDLDGFCYGSMVNATVLRRQWAEMVARNKDKVIPNMNLHLLQSFIGRSLYVLPLEWWYSIFPKEEIYFICTEELQDLSGDPLTKVANFLGLPPFNFSQVVSRGAYNVGGYRGYDQEVSWSRINNENKTLPGKHDIPLSDEIRRQFLDFVAPYNERLFQVTGRRCNW